MFCVVKLENIKSGKSKSQLQAVPRGTGFAISDKYVLTARHNCIDDLDLIFPAIGLVREMRTTKGIVESTIIKLKPVASNSVDDWAVFERESGTFPASVNICSEAGLPRPGTREPLGIKDYPVGFIDSSSTSKLEVMSVFAKFCYYEERLPENGRTRKGSVLFSVPVVKDADALAQMSPAIEDVIMVDGGRATGSCGAPYFNLRGEVVAFHVESVNDGDEKSSSRDSHVSYSHGYVLCRLPSFVSWYECSISTIIPTEG